MKILFDQNVPRPLARFLHGHVVYRSAEVGWAELKDGDLLRAAEGKAFDVLVTADRNLSYQQNLKGRRLAIVVLPSGRWPKVKMRLQEVVDAVNGSHPGGFVEMEPFPPPRPRKH